MKKVIETTGRLVNLPRRDIYQDLQSNINQLEARLTTPDMIHKRAHNRITQKTKSCDVFFLDTQVCSSLYSPHKKGSSYHSSCQSTLQACLQLRLT